MSAVEFGSSPRLPAPQYPIKSRLQLKRYIDGVCPKLGLNAPAIWKAIRDRKPAGRFILALMGVDESVLVAHRSRDIEQSFRITMDIRNYEEDGLSRTAAIARVARERGVNRDTIRASLRQNPNVIADLLFEEPQPTYISLLPEI